MDRPTPRLATVLLALALLVAVPAAPATAAPESPWPAPGTDLHRVLAGVSRQASQAGFLLGRPRPAPRPSPTAAAAPQPADGNPLATAAWANGCGPSEVVCRAWAHSSGSTRALLGRIATRPRALWFGHWFGTGEVALRIRHYIDAAQAGDTSRIVHLAIFRLWPRQESARHSPLSASEQGAYRAWIDQAAAGIGASPVAIVLEPDLGIAAYDSADPRVRLGLARYAARRLAALPHAAVYLDGSSADWLTVERSAAMLKEAGVQYVRGFALGATHYSPLGAEVDYGTRVAQQLARIGVPGRHFVVDTADNGRGFTWPQYWHKHPHGDFDNAEPCRDRAESVCDTLGVPPTHDVAEARWGLDPGQLAEAADLVDGYLWFGRPWLYRQAAPYRQDRALQVARTTPY